MELITRPAKPYDVLNIAKLGLCYSLGNQRESIASLSPKVAEAESWVAEVGNYMVGYAIALPTRREELPPLSLEYHRVFNPNCLHIVSLCVVNRFHGIGIGSTLVGRVKQSKYDILTVCAWHNSERFWRRHLFEPVRILNYLNQPVPQLEYIRA